MAGEDPLPIGGAVTASTAAPDAPLLVIVDSRGRLTRFDWLLGVPFWRGILVASAASTPDSHLALLDRHGIPHLTTGTNRGPAGCSTSSPPTTTSGVSVSTAAVS